MPPVRSMPMTKPVKTERSHEENQERAYIAASRRSDRSLEARVESARRASEIHKRRTGRSLRVREEDVMNEEMYEEEDDDLPSQLRRINALQGLTGPFSDRLQSSLAMQLGMRDALSQALLRNQQYQNATANANAGGDANSVMSPMQPSVMNSGMASPHNMSGPYMGPQSWQMASNMQNMSRQYHARSASFATAQDSMYQQQMSSPNMQHSGMNYQADARRLSMPMQASNPQKSPLAGSVPTTPLIDASANNVSQSPLQVPTPPYSASASTPGQTSSAADSPQESRATLPKTRSAKNLSNPLTLQLPQETQQMFGFIGQGYNNAYYPQQSLKSPGNSAYSYNPNGARKGQNQHELKRNNGMFQQHGHTGLNQTISPSALYNFDNTGFSLPSSNDFAELPSSALSEPTDMSYGGMMGFNDDFNNSYNYGNGMSGFGDNMASGWNTPGAVNTAEPSWNPEDFVNFGPPT